MKIIFWLKKTKSVNFHFQNLQFWKRQCKKFMREIKAPSLQSLKPTMPIFQYKRFQLMQHPFVLKLCSLLKSLMASGQRLLLRALINVWIIYGLLSLKGICYIQIWPNLKQWHQETHFISSTVAQYKTLISGNKINNNLNRKG